MAGKNKASVEHHCVSLQKRVCGRHPMSAAVAAANAIGGRAAKSTADDESSISESASTRMMLRSTARALRSQGGREFREGLQKATSAFEKSAGIASSAVIEGSNAAKAGLSTVVEKAIDTRQQLAFLNQDVRSTANTVREVDEQVTLLGNRIIETMKTSEQRSREAIRNMTDPGVSVAFVAICSIVCLGLLIMHAWRFSSHGDTPFTRATLFLGGAAGVSALTMLASILCGCTTRV